MNKNILITGSDGGIGSELVNYLFGIGYQNIFCQYRSKKDTIFSILDKHNRNHNDYCFCANLADEPDIIRMRDEIYKRYGGVWGIINLAGSSSNNMSWNLSEADFMSVINNNLLSTFLCAKSFIPEMRRFGAGRIINISSVVAFSGVVGASHYCSAKAGVVGLTKALAKELANKGITVNALVLGYFNYGMINQIPIKIQEQIRTSIPMQRFGNIEEIGGLINFLLSPESSYITGQAIHLNGGLY